MIPGRTLKPQKWPQKCYCCSLYFFPNCLVSKNFENFLCIFFLLQPIFKGLKINTTIIIWSTLNAHGNYTHAHMLINTKWSLLLTQIIRKNKQSILLIKAGPVNYFAKSIKGHLNFAIDRNASSFLIPQIDNHFNRKDSN